MTVALSWLFRTTFGTCRGFTSHLPLASVTQGLRRFPDHLTLTPYVRHRTITISIYTFQDVQTGLKRRFSWLDENKVWWLEYAGGSRENSLLTGSEVAQESVGPSAVTGRASGRSEARTGPSLSLVRHARTLRTEGAFTVITERFQNGK